MPYNLYCTTKQICPPHAYNTPPAFLFLFFTTHNCTTHGPFYEVHNLNIYINDISLFFIGYSLQPNVKNFLFINIDR